jgi:hypothetical protein
VIPEPGGSAGREPGALGRHDGQRLGRHHAGQRGPPQFGTASVGAGGAPLYVPVEPLAHACGETPVPPREQGVKLIAVVAPGEAHQQHAEAAPEPVARP